MIALHFSVSGGNMESTVALLSLEVDPDISEFSGLTPLLSAISTQPVDICMIELLLDYQADVNARGAKGAHPLGLAIITGQIEAARTLISRGSRVSSVFQWEKELTILLAAANLLRSNAMVNLILQSGAQVTTRTAKDRSPLSLAVATGHVDILESLLKRLPQGRLGSAPLGESLQVAINLGGRVELLRVLFEAGAGIDVAEPNNLAALLHAAAKSDFETIEVLLEYGLDVNATIQGQSVLSTILNVPVYTAHGTQRSDAAYCLKLLLDHGANDWEGGLTARAASGSVQAARALLDLDHERCPPKLPVSWYLGFQVRILKQIDPLYDRSLVSGG